MKGIGNLSEMFVVDGPVRRGNDKSAVSLENTPYLFQIRFRIWQVLDEFKGSHYTKCLRLKG